MRTLLALGLFSAALLLVGCGGDDDDDNGPDDSDKTTDSDDSTDSDSGDSGLTCATYGWCTSYSALDEEVTDAPSLTGGTITDGIYRLQQGTFGAEAFAFGGSTVVQISDSWSNNSGTWTAKGGRLTTKLTTSCSKSGEEQLNETWEYDFAVQGDDLYLLLVGGVNNRVHRYKKVSSLCTEDAEFKCDVTNCGCAETVNEPLSGESCF